MHTASHPKDDIDRLCIKKGGRGFTSIQECVDGSIGGAENYIKKNQDRLIAVVRGSPVNVSTNRSAT